MYGKTVIVERTETNHFMCGFKNGVITSLRGMVINIPLFGVCLAGLHVFGGTAAATSTTVAEAAATAAEAASTVI